MAKFSPLILLGQINSLPQVYGQTLPLFDNNSQIAARQHIRKVTDFIDLEEIDADDAKMRIIVQVFLEMLKPDLDL